MTKFFKDLGVGERFLWTDTSVNIGAKLVLMKITPVSGDDAFGFHFSRTSVCIEGVALGTLGNTKDDALVEVVGPEYRLDQPTKSEKNISVSATKTFEGIWSGNQITFTDSDGEKCQLTTEIEMPGTDNPVRVYFDDKGSPQAFDEDGLGIKILWIFSFL